MPGLRDTSLPWAQVRGDGVVRVANTAGWVLRFNP